MHSVLVLVSSLCRTFVFVYWNELDEVAFVNETKGHRGHNEWGRDRLKVHKLSLLRIICVQMFMHRNMIRNLPGVVIEGDENIY